MQVRLSMEIKSVKCLNLQAEQVAVQDFCFLIKICETWKHIPCYGFLHLRDEFIESKE